MDYTHPVLVLFLVGGVIIGLALQESLSNVFSGLLFTLDGAVRIGDLVRLGSGKEGYVRAVGWRSTQLKLHDETLLVVPNSVMSKEVIENLSRPSDSLIVSIEVAVQVGEKLPHVEELALAVLREVQGKFAHGKELPPPWVRWRQIGDAGIVARLFLPVASIEDQFQARSELLREVHDRFQSEKITIPLPLRVLQPPSGSA
jgi:small-conductance mechanosensitive channel